MPSIPFTVTGRVIEVLVKPGDAVAAGDAVMTIESMKMEIPLEAEVAGTVAEVLVAAGQDIVEGQNAVVLE
ncbi:biotin/lipoyl-containing protein [Noviherbaspirillum sp. Root189]|uniref:biotin/lipoyl-containing protein n=1 Tax=Noviherbaspirillum sp. Root189 TaxID=1736487 RepID=UPI00070A77A3|nr:biotin/lipoyl-containing protein [Noviherbaspirillum sp. Root189]KRB67986.1 hypothetical protein ASE07_10060 [Noviherbaspirillum sp. Root189]